MNENQKLSKIKKLIEDSVADDSKRNFYLGQAIAIVDDMLDSPESSPQGPIEIPSHILQQMKPNSSASMEGAVSRHKELHQELSKDAVSKKNTQFKKLS